LFYLKGSQDAWGLTFGYSFSDFDAATENNQVDEDEEEPLEENFDVLGFGYEDPSMPNASNEHSEELPLEYELDRSGARRGLMMDHGLHEPLDCNANLTSAICLPLSQLGGNNIVACGECYEVDTTDGSVIEYAGGLTIKGKLTFPATANVTIRAKYVFVLGVLKIVPPAAGNQVKFSMYQEEEVTYTAPSMDDECGMGCGLGSKVIAVLGGKFLLREIQ
jgi:hypothetical protein